MQKSGLRSVKDMRPSSCPTRRKKHLLEKCRSFSESNAPEKPKLLSQQLSVDENINRENAKSDPIKKKFQRPPPRLPFCEEYDGINMRRTTTISQSIKELMETQKRNQSDEDSANGNLYYESTTTIETFDNSNDITRCTIHELNNNPASPDSGINNYFDADNASLSSNIDPFEDLHINRTDREDVCSIDLELNYLSHSNQLALSVIKAEDVTDAKQPNKLIDTFVKVSMYHGKKNKKQRSTVVQKSRDPVFMHTFVLDNVCEKWMHIMCVRIQLYEKKKFRTNCIGETLVWLDDLDLVSSKHVCVTEGLQKPYL